VSIPVSPEYTLRSSGSLLPDASTRFWPRYYASGATNLLAASSVRDLGVYIDISADAHLRRWIVLLSTSMPSVHISQRALLTLVSTSVANKNDYCCSVMVDVLGHLMHRLQSLEPSDSSSETFRAHDPFTQLRCNLQSVVVLGADQVPSVRPGVPLSHRHYRILLRAFVERPTSQASRRFRSSITTTVIAHSTITHPLDDSAFEMATSWTCKSVCHYWTRHSVQS